MKKPKAHPWRQVKPHAEVYPPLSGDCIGGPVYRINDKRVSREEYEIWRKTILEHHAQLSTANKEKK
jgi:hypothetical protein